MVLLTETLTKNPSVVLVNNAKKSVERRTTDKHEEKSYVLLSGYKVVEPEDSVLVFEKKLRQNPDDTETKEELSRLYQHKAVCLGKADAKGNIVEVAQLLEKALKLTPENEILKYILSRIYSDMGAYYANGKVEGKTQEDAVGSLKKALTFNPENTQAKKNLSLLLPAE